MYQVITKKQLHKLQNKENKWAVYNKYEELWTCSSSTKNERDTKYPEKTLFSSED